MFSLVEFAILALALQTTPAVQLVQPQGPAAPPIVVTLQDALDRAKSNDVQLQSAVADAQVAREDRFQARTALLPSVSNSTQYLGTQGNGAFRAAALFQTMVFTCTGMGNRASGSHREHFP